MSFTLIPANTFIWNHDDFLRFLIDNQGRAIKISTNQEGVCLRTSGVYQLIEQFGYTDVTILTNNLLESHPTFQINFASPFHFFKISHSNYKHLHTWNQNKVFGCLYNRPLWFRIGLATVLQHDYANITLLNMRSSAQEIDQRVQFETEQLFNYHPETFQKFAKVFDTWPIMLEQTDGYTVGNNTTGHTDQLASFYADFLIDIVAETWASGQTFFATEKTVRPMLLKKPFILFGSRSYLLHLRQMGFMTFGNFWDEDYDGYEGQDRFVKILELINTLSKKSKSELNNMYWEMQYTLDHNYELLQNQNYTTQITSID